MSHIYRVASNWRLATSLDYRPLKIPCFYRVASNWRLATSLDYRPLKIPCFSSGLDSRLWFDLYLGRNIEN